ncbi:hypothetical protein ONS95_007787 [Cadophora gregata]|uniref:uncharacterized protein n=1 Tax=Cadophora gregata TaxID=51156 RepID=UPI0026DCB425|nr:uncharacterized protein ONS95_007787 [Cadophora gregata]KAK0118915.1 hypothetical protein ONS96_011992 [Cadophora gregata f. sp. sojae]KAK0126169.1 hypothetical protein ONS95_007787 [Cadophora gregata]
MFLLLCAIQLVFRQTPPEHQPSRPPFCRLLRTYRPYRYFGRFQVASTPRYELVIGVDVLKHGEDMSDPDEDFTDLSSMWNYHLPQRRDIFTCYATNRHERYWATCLATI